MSPSTSAGEKRILIDFNHPARFNLLGIAISSNIHNRLRSFNVTVPGWSGVSSFGNLATKPQSFTKDSHCATRRPGVLVAIMFLRHIMVSILDTCLNAA